MNTFVTSVNENITGSEVELFPNPTPDDLFIKLSGKKIVNYYITNLYGQELMKEMRAMKLRFVFQPLNYHTVFTL
ncbi:MAG: hypothetical protein IPJ60_15185 [Sphingobacteriaceae bacterium]|nr:hypothetical protein [Sphingobacteriaceae bacterium]